MTSLESSSDSSEEEEIRRPRSKKKVKRKRNPAQRSEKKIKQCREKESLQLGTEIEGRDNTIVTPRKEQTVEIPVKALEEVKTFIDLMENAWSVSELSVSEEIDVQESSIASTENHAERRSQSCEGHRETSSSHRADFTGFESGVSQEVTGVNILNGLKVLKTHAQKNRELAMDFGEKNNEFLRALWGGNYMASEDRFASGESRREKSIKVIPKRLRFDVLTSTPRRTRSQGRVRNLPNVQPRILEYNTKR